MAADKDIVYRINAQDRFTFVNAEWDRFASANSGEASLSGKIMALPLWDFVSDETTRLLYRGMLKRVRAGHRVRFPFRCDSPACRRFMTMDAHLTARDAVEFQTRIQALQERPPQALLDPSRLRAGTALRACGWCAKVAVGDGWDEIEAAVTKLNLFGSASLPMITHGICPKCEAAMSNALGET